MAAPNLASPTTVTGKTAVLANVPATATDVISAVATGHAAKVNSIIVSNKNASTNYTVTLTIVRSATAYSLATTVVVPANSSLDVLSARVYLEEGDALKATASSANQLDVVASYEDIA